MTCAKRRVFAVAEIGGILHIGENYCDNQQTVCPRSESEDYSKCKSICNQKHHAEIDLIEKVGGDLKGSTVYLLGHDHACKPCMDALVKANAGEIKIKGGQH